MKNIFTGLSILLFFLVTAKSQIPIKQLPKGNINTIAKPSAHALLLDRQTNGTSFGTIVRTNLVTGIPANFRWTNANTDDAFLLLDATTIRYAGYMIRDKDGNNIEGKILFRNGIKIQVPGQATQITVSSAWQMLGLFDQNKDGKIDSMDPVWQSLSLFSDTNADGIINPGEVTNISGSAFRSISLTGHSPEKADPSGNRRVDGSFTQVNGSTGTVSDVNFGDVGDSETNPSDIDITKPIVKTSTHALLIDPNGNDLNLGNTVRTDLLTGTPTTFRWTNANTDDAFLLLDATSIRFAGFTISDKNANNMDGKLVFRDGIMIQSPGLSSRTIVTSAWQMLGVFDQNKDGKIDNLDPVWQSLSLYSDKNADGIINPGEVKPMGESPLRSISLTGHSPETTDASGNRRVNGTFTRSDGTTGTVTDINFGETDNSESNTSNNNTRSRNDSLTEKSRPNTANAEKWEINKVNAKSGTGKLYVTLPSGTEWDITIYPAGSTKVLSNTMLQQTFSLLPGSYDLEINHIWIKGVPIEKGNDTRLKTGVLHISNSTSWTLYDAAKKIVVINSTSAQHRGVPIGKYKLTIMGQDQDIEIKDGETVEF